MEESRTKKRAFTHICPVMNMFRTGNPESLETGYVYGSHERFDGPDLCVNVIRFNDRGTAEGMILITTEQRKNSVAEIPIRAPGQFEAKGFAEETE